MANYISFERKFCSDFKNAKSAISPNPTVFVLTMTIFHFKWSKWSFFLKFQKMVMWPIYWNKHKLSITNWIFSPPPFSERDQIQDIYILFTCCIIFTCFLVPQIVQKIMLPLLLGSIWWDFSFLESGNGTSFFLSPFKYRMIFG